MIGRELSILFWNLNKKDLNQELAQICLQRDVDIIIIAEAQNLNFNALLTTLNSSSVQYYNANTFSLSSKIYFITKFDPIYVNPIYEDEADRFSIRKLTLPKTREIIIGGVHLLDQKNYSKASRLAYAIDVKHQIEEIEDSENINSTILVGDFNMNPFEDGMMQANGFNATLSRSIASRKPRKILGKTFSYFYNPSWSLMGDLSSTPAGTYYYNKAGFDPFYWNMFDQVIIRESLTTNFDNNSYEIIDNFGTHSLLSKSGLPNRIQYSDHLPIFFKLLNL